MSEKSILHTVLTVVPSVLILIYWQKRVFSKMSFYLRGIRV